MLTRDTSCPQIGPLYQLQICSTLTTLASAVPVSECSIGLLTGYNCPRALVPTEVIPPVGNGPYAHRTALGWGIVGVINSGLEYDSINASHLGNESWSKVALRTSVKEVLDPRVITRILESDFSESCNNDRKKCHKKTFNS